MLGVLRGKRGQWAIIEIVVVVAIILVAAYFILPNYLSGAGKGKGGETDRVHTPIGQAESVECRNNLSQLRSSIEMESSSSEDGRPPASIAYMGPSVSPISKCPISGKEYDYAPSSGRVSCSTPGHEKY